MVKPTPAFVSTINALASAYSKELDEPTIAAYWIGVSDIEPEWVRKAAVKIIRSPAVYMPRPGELREVALEFRPKPERLIDRWRREDSGKTTAGLLGWRKALKKHFPKMKLPPVDTDQGA